MRGLLIVSAWLMAGAAFAEPAAPPSKEDVATALTRIYGWRPDFELTVYLVEPSRLPGFAVAWVALKKDDFTTVYISADGKSAILGELTPFGADPYAQTREILKAVDGPSRGGAAGGIDLVEFADLECPPCRAMQPNLDKLAAEFPRVREIVEAAPQPPHPWARLAASWGDCIARRDAKAYWPFAEAVFAAQGDITLKTAPARLRAIAASQGLDPDKTAACANAPATAARLAAAEALANRALVDGTPTVFVNGREMKPGFTYDELRAVVRFELAQAGR